MKNYICSFVFQHSRSENVSVVVAGSDVGSAETSIHNDFVVAETVVESCDEHVCKVSGIYHRWFW